MNIKEEIDDLCAEVNSIVDRVARERLTAGIVPMFCDSECALESAAALLKRIDAETGDRKQTALLISRLFGMLVDHGRVRVRAKNYSTGKQTAYSLCSFSTMIDTKVYLNGPEYSGPVSELVFEALERRRTIKRRAKGASIKRKGVKGKA